MVKIVRPIFQEASPTLYLEIAEKIEKRVKLNRQVTEDGIYWVTKEDGAAVLSHYTGSAGIIRFYMELAEATARESYLAEAIAGADYLIAHFSCEVFSYGDEKDAMGILTSQTAFNQAEIGILLIELTQQTQIGKYAEFAREIFTQIAAQAQPTKEGVTWSGLPDIGQDSGVILLLIEAAKYFEVQSWLEIALQGAEAILSTEIAEKVGARYTGYRNLMQFLSKSQNDNEKTSASFPVTLFEDNYFPNFSHGVSGICYGFLRVYETTGDQRFLEAAKKGAALIEEISVPIQDGYLVPYLYPNNRENIFYLSYCHGPAGTGRLFYELFKVTGEKAYLTFYKKLFVGVTNTGAPELNSTGYWKNHSQCCGSAGLLHAFSGSYLATEDNFYLDLAKRTADKILSEAQEDHEGLVHWYQNWTRSEPANIGEYLGYGIGDVGVASALIEFYGVLTNGFIPNRLFDDPYPKSLKGIKKEEID